MLRNYLAIARSRILRDGSLARTLSAAVLTLSVVFLGWKTYDSWDAIRNYTWHIRYVWLIPSFALYLLHTTMAVQSWQFIMNCLAQALPFREHARVYWLTNLMRRIPAGLFWVVAGRAYAYRNRNVSARTSTLASFLEIWVVVLTGLPLALLFAPWLGLLSVTDGLALAIAAWCVALGLIHPIVIGRILRLVDHEAFEHAPTYGNMLSLVLRYTLIWLVGGVGLFATAGLFVELQSQHLPATMGAWVVSNMVSYVLLLSFGGLGLRELSLTVLLGAILVDPLPLLIGLTMRLTWTVYDVIVGLAALRL